MPTLPVEYLSLILWSVPLFSRRIWSRIQVLLIGAILAPGPRAVAAVLRIMGLGQEKHFQNYHRLLNRAIWSSYKTSRLLLGSLVSALAPHRPIILGLDDTIERRRGAGARVPPYPWLMGLGSPRRRVSLRRVPVFPLRCVSISPLGCSVVASIRLPA